MCLFNPPIFPWRHCPDPRSECQNHGKSLQPSIASLFCPFSGSPVPCSARCGSPCSKLTCQLPLHLKTFEFFSSAVRIKAKVITISPKALSDSALYSPLCPSVLSNVFLPSHLFTLLAASIWKAFQVHHSTSIYSTFRPSSSRLPPPQSSFPVQIRFICCIFPPKCVFYFIFWRWCDLVLEVRSPKWVLSN